MKATILAFCGLLTLGTSLAARADSAATGQPKGGKMTYESGKQVEEQNLRKLTLKVKDVDKANHRVTFEAQVAPEAQVAKDGQPIKLDELKAGDEVRAAFDPKTGEVQKLEIERAGSKTQMAPQTK
jgi:hypothetical protein